MTVSEQAVELLPCPFCGGEAELITPTETDRWAQVNCKACGCRGTEYPAEITRAVAAWNKRALPLMGVMRPEDQAFVEDARQYKAANGFSVIEGLVSIIDRALPAQSGSVQCREDVARISKEWFYIGHKQSLQFADAVLAQIKAALSASPVSPENKE